MNTMDHIQQHLDSELREFESTFRKSVKSKTALLDRIMHYVIKRKGKQVRPMFVLLSARLFGPIKDSTYRAAALVELLHTATLVHDDVVDEAFERRNFFSINALWKNKIAVLVGDYLLSRGLLLSLEHDDFKILKLLSQAVQKMSEGELLQLEKARGLNLDESVYFEIIRNKTASLLASACGAGAWSSTEDENITQKMMLFGEKAGIAFQIKDDLFDYGSTSVGKPTGNDIREKKITLPLLYTLNQVSGSKKRALIYLIKNENRNKKSVQQIIDEVQHHGGIAYATECMHRYRDEAIALLHDFEDNPYRSALEQLVRFTTDRKY
ncbi:MAG: polyprenyl synthetase family protein [Chitinophagaceae bacterium]